MKIYLSKIAQLQLMNLHKIKQAPKQGTFKSWFGQICINRFTIPRISMAWAETVACRNSARNVSIEKLKEIINDIIILNWMWLFNSYSMLYPPKFLAISFLLSGMFPSAGVNIAETWVRNDKWFFCWNILQTALPARCAQSFSFGKQFWIMIIIMIIIIMIIGKHVFSAVVFQLVQSYQSFVGKKERNQWNDSMTILWNQRKRRNLN